MGSRSGGAALRLWQDACRIQAARPGNKGDLFVIKAFLSGNVFENTEEILGDRAVPTYSGPQGAGEFRKWNATDCMRT
jgi:hypothetical protein